jgi:hypothetical protein
MTIYTETLKLSDTAANWTSNNPTPASKCVCIESDTQKVKIGDGATAWTSLPYTDPSGLPIDAIVPNSAKKFLGSTTPQSIGALSLSTLTSLIASCTDSTAATVLTSINTELQSIGTYVNKLELAIARMGACT